MKFFKSDKEKESMNEISDIELLELEDDILSETGGGNSPNIGCGIEESTNVGCSTE